jgi:hypothetical protein
MTNTPAHTRISDSEDAPRPTAPVEVEIGINRVQFRQGRRVVTLSSHMARTLRDILPDLISIAEHP